MRVFFDSSAFAKRYIDETGTAEVIDWCDRATELALSVVAVPELISAFCRLQREGKLTPEQYGRAKRDLMADISDALVCDTTPGVVQHAILALETHALRGMDAIHIGAGLECRADVFVTADQRQSAAAKAVGLTVAEL